MSTPTRQIIADNVDTLLRSVAIPRAELAQGMGIGEGSLNRARYGYGNQSVEILDRIAEYFHIETWRLLAPKLGKNA
jgi:transcriptional regulator with XRE-family HTH domain